MGTTLSFLWWEALADKETMKYGSMWYIKGVLKNEEKLFGHMVRTLEGNAKRPPKGQGVVAATKEGRKRGQRVVAVLSPVTSGGGQGTEGAGCGSSHHQAGRKRKVGAE